ncbi:MAG: NAD+ synthetase, partial [Myxococcales bacterium]|nr:NAD+ synthetase [Myxococcales bacterium]
MRVTVGAAVLNQTPLDWDRNERNLREVLAAARDARVTVLCLPELAITGYGCEDAFYGPHVGATAEAILSGLLPETRGMFVCFGLPVRWSGALYNAAAVAVDGRLVAVVPKQHLAGDGIHYEPRWFKEWPAGQRDEITLCGTRLPIGDLHVDCGGLRIGFEICEDAWVADRPGGRLGRRGVEVLVNPSASHFSFDKIDVRRRLVVEGSRAFNAVYLYANLLGNEAGRAIYDGGALIAADGRLIAEGQRLSFLPWQLTTAVADLEVARARRARSASFRPLHDPDDDRVAVPFVWPVLPPEPAPTVTLAAWETLPPPARKREEFTRAIGLALLDYLEKAHMRGFAIS